MSGEVVRLVNIALLCFCNLVTVLILFSFRKGTMQVRASRALFTEIAAVFFSMTFYTASLVFHRDSYYVFGTCSLAASYLGIYLIYYFYVAYIREQINQMERERSVSKAVTYTSLAIFVAAAIMWVLSIFDAGSNNVRVGAVSFGPAFAVGNAGCLMLLAFCLVLLLRHYKALGVRQTVLLSSMPVLMLIVTFAEPFVNGIEIRYPAIVLVIILIYSRHYLDLENRAQRAENDEIRLRLRMATDRMKPHYLYNVLTTIYYLCDTDPAKAQYAIGLFAEYMRNTLETMEKHELVYFSWELEEISQYLSLEKLRFGDRLNIELDADYTDFMVPPLSIQPLVENAVKHGISPSEKGGTVRITTREISGGGAQIIIQDDGVGFDVSTLGELDRSHEGVANVRERIRLEIGGDMVISSEPGKGTTAIVTLWPAKNGAKGRAPEE